MSDGVALATLVRDGIDDGRGAAATVRLRPVRVDDAPLLTQWRNEHGACFFSQFRATEPRTRRWLLETALDRPDRILFMIETADGTPYGHVGLANARFAERRVEIDNMVRGVRGVAPGGMTRATRCLLAWAFETLSFERIEGRLFADNARSLRHHERLGFRVVDRVPLRCVQRGDEVRWVPTTPEAAAPDAREMAVIELDRLRARAGSRAGFSTEARRGPRRGAEREPDEDR